ncbi:hypothetical protein PI125_g8284 [Phytophthora idaei]|nr:hypothetical protein PI125_g8284 [Phytophthora idaei]
MLTARCHVHLSNLGHASGNLLLHLGPREDTSGGSRFTIIHDDPDNHGHTVQPQHVESDFTELERHVVPEVGLYLYVTMRQKKIELWQVVRLHAKYEVLDIDDDKLTNTGAKEAYCL